MSGRIEEVDVGEVVRLISAIGDDESTAGQGTGSRAEFELARIGNDGSDGCYPLFHHYCVDR